MTQIPDPPQDRLLHSSGFRAGEVQQHLEKEKLQMSPGSKHPLQQEQCDSAPGQDFHGPSRLPLTLSKVLMGSCSRSPLQAWDKGPGQPCCKADAILCSHSTPKELGASPRCFPRGSEPLPTAHCLHCHSPRRGQSLLARVRNSPETPIIFTGQNSKMSCSTSSTLEAGELSTITSSMVSTALRVCKEDRE